jgi:hypothetical protein
MGTFYNASIGSNFVKAWILSKAHSSPGAASLASGNANNSKQGGTKCLRGLEFFIGVPCPKVCWPLSPISCAMNCYYSNLIEGHDTHPVSLDLIGTIKTYN